MQMPFQMPEPSKFQPIVTTVELVNAIDARIVFLEKVVDEHLAPEKAKMDAFQADNIKCQDLIKGLNDDLTAWSGGQQQVLDLNGTQYMLDLEGLKALTADLVSGSALAYLSDLKTDEVSAEMLDFVIANTTTNIFSWAHGTLAQMENQLEVPEEERVAPGMTPMPQPTPPNEAELQQLQEKLGMPVGGIQEAKAHRAEVSAIGVESLAVSLEIYSAYFKVTEAELLVTLGFDQPAIPAAAANDA